MYKKGLITTIIVIVIALIILGYFGFNIKDILNSPTVQANLNAAGTFCVNIWNNYLAGPVMWFWNTFVIGFVWKYVQAGLANIHP
jgi:hypothetical protein